MIDHDGVALPIPVAFDVICAVYGTPTVPSGSVAVVTASVCADAPSANRTPANASFMVHRLYRSKQAPPLKDGLRSPLSA
jgi:hypothetical protein